MIWLRDPATPELRDTPYWSVSLLACPLVECDSGAGDFGEDGFGGGGPHVGLGVGVVGVDVALDAGDDVRGRAIVNPESIYLRDTMAGDPQTDQVGTNQGRWKE